MAWQASTACGRVAPQRVVPNRAAPEFKILDPGGGARGIQPTGEGFRSAPSIAWEDGERKTATAGFSQRPIDTTVVHAAATGLCPSPSGTLARDLAGRTQLGSRLTFGRNGSPDRSGSSMKAPPKMRTKTA